MVRSSLKKHSSVDSERADSRNGGGSPGRSNGNADAGGAPEPSTTDETMSSAEVQFEQLCQVALREAGEVSAAQRDSILEDLALRFEHPGEYVAYIDHYRVRGRIRRLSREILGHSTDLSVVKAAFARFDSKKRAQVQVEYLEPLSDDFELIHDLPFR